MVEPGTRNILLTVLNGDEKGRMFVVAGDSPIVIGRGEDSTVQLSATDPKISRKHAYIEHRLGSWRLVQMVPSRNIPWINGVPQDQCVLADGDVVQLGDTRIKVSLEPGVFRSFRCTTCGEDLSDLANSDGRALELAGAVVYVCPRHVLRTEQLAEKVIGKYELCSRLGKGSEGIVYRVYDPSTGRLLALKHLRDLRSVDKIRRFDLQMSELRDLRHSNIIRFVESGVDEQGIPFFVSEYAPEGSLANLASKLRYQLPPALTVRIFLDVLDGLKYLHSRGDIHRDIKPENILLGRSGDQGNPLVYTPKIGDFGLVKKLGALRITKPNEAIGTIGFMSPEQILNFSGLDVRADVYSMGATMYFILTGSFPVDLREEANEAEQLQRVRYDDRIPVQRRVPDVPLRLARVVDQACQREASLRFESAERLQQALRDTL